MDPQTEIVILVVFAFTALMGFLGNLGSAGGRRNRLWLRIDD